MPNIDLSILNQRQTPAFYADVLANRPAAGFIGRIFVSTNTFEFYRDNGNGWDLIGGPGTGAITGGGSLYRVGIWTSTSNLGESNNLVFDYSTNRLGINTNTPGASLDVHSTQSIILQLNQTSLNDTRIAFQLSGSALWRLGNYYNGGANDFELFDVIAAQAPLTIKKTTGQVLIGTNIVGAGKLVVASAFGDNGIQIVGATSPSLRIDNAASGATKRAGLGIATNTNNFIQGSADRDFCIFNGSTAAASPILFGVYDAGLTNVQEAARISAARNLLIGTTTDAGFKLDVNGIARVQGALTVTGDVIISNASYYRSLTSTGTSVRMLGINAGNVAYVGAIDAGVVSTIFNASPTSLTASFYTSGTEKVRIDTNGSVGIGSTSLTGYSLRVSKNIVGATTSFGVVSDGQIQSGVTNIAYLFSSNPSTQATSFSLTNIVHYNASLSSIGAGSSITNQFGFLAENTLIGATNNYGFYGNIASGTNRWNLYMNGTANNYLNGTLLIGTTSVGGSKLRIVGLPTSAAGLSSGDIYSNAGILTIVP
jgi:hypothetical protein